MPTSHLDLTVETTIVGGKIVYRTTETTLTETTYTTSPVQAVTSTYRPIVGVKLAISIMALVIVTTGAAILLSRRRRRILKT